MSGGTGKVIRLLVTCCWLLVIGAGNVFGAPTFIISGYVQTSGGAGVEGVSVAGSNGATSGYTGADGAYSITVPNHWDGTITVSKAGWLITPASKTYNRVSSNLINENYTAYQPKISGYVKKANETAISGATVSATGGASTTTNASGYYEIAVPYQWSGTLNASFIGYGFTAKSFTNVTTDQINQDFTGYQPKISGYVRKSDGTAFSGASVSASGIGSTITNASGYYEIIATYGWSGTISISFAGYSFTEKTYINVTRDQESQDFIGTLLVNKYGGGTGVQTDPYLIATTEHLVVLSKDPNDWNDKYFNLTADLNMSGVSGFTPIGTDDVKYFRGNFDGNGHVISNLKYKGKYGPAGLFGCISDATIKNVVLSDANVTVSSGTYFDYTYSFAGGIAGKQYNGMVNNCRVTGAVAATSYYDSCAGGLVGRQYSGTIVGCSATIIASASSHDYSFAAVGGVVGYQDSGIISNCSSSGDLKSYSSWSYSSVAGGVAGRLSGGIIVNCFSTATASAWAWPASSSNCSSSAGGLVGSIGGGAISDSYATGSANAYSASGDYRYGYSGGLTGSISNGTMDRCYATGTATVYSEGGEYYVGGFIGYQTGGAINNSHAVGTASASSSSSVYMATIGGFVGYQTGGTITNCYAVGNVGGNCRAAAAGGFAGRQYKGTINGCYAAGNIVGSYGYNGYAGGFIGIQSYGMIANCYSRCAIAIVPFYAGGLVGEHDGGTITNCYAVVTIAGGKNVGGLIGGMGGGAINSFWDTQISSIANSSGGKGRTTAQMKRADSYIGWNTDVNIWVLDEGNDYPRLVWENTGGTLLPAYSLSNFVPGSGTQTNPYRITTAEQFDMVGLFPATWDKMFSLDADINLVGMELNGIGCSSIGFTGIFEGNGHAISNLNCVFNHNYAGLFAQIGSTMYVGVPIYGGTVKNLILIDPIVDVNGSLAGALCGCANFSTITNCQILNGIVKGKEDVGGVVGLQDGGTFTNVTWEGDVVGTRCTGGFVGYMYYDYGNMKLCGAKGKVQGGDYTGGFVGYLNTNLSDCYSMCDVNGLSNVGVFAGYVYNGRKVNRCYSDGQVVASGGKGAFAGYCSTTSPVTDFNSCFYNAQKEPNLPALGNIVDADVHGVTANELRTAATFTALGWDFAGETANGTADIWTICEGTNTPKFVWQIAPADFTCPDGVSLSDFAFFAQRWLNTDCPSMSNCDGADMDESGMVDMSDLLEFTAWWLDGM